jgi:hypothetical protein
LQRQDLCVEERVAADENLGVAAGEASAADRQTRICGRIAL